MSVTSKCYTAYWTTALALTSQGVTILPKFRWVTISPGFTPIITFGGNTNESEQDIHNVFGFQIYFILSKQPGSFYFLCFDHSLLQSIIFRKPEEFMAAVQKNYFCLARLLKMSIFFAIILISLFTKHNFMDLYFANQSLVNAKVNNRTFQCFTYNNNINLYIYKNLIGKCYYSIVFNRK